MKQRLRIGGACLNQIPMDWDNNLRNIFSAIDSAKKDKIKLLCLPELSITGYGCEDMFLSEWLPKKALEKLIQIIPHTKDIAVAVGLPIVLDQKVYNTTCLIHDQEVLGIYAKQKLANDGVHYEPRWFTSWESGKTIDYKINGTNVPFGHITVDLFNIKIGFEICEDAWREDRPASHDLYENVDLILNPSASHFAFGKAEFRENLVIRSSEIFNCTYLYSNLLGNESGRMIYDGDILVAQQGELIAKNSRLSFQDFKILGSTIDFQNPKQSEVVLIDDIDGNYEEFPQASSLALFDYLRKSRNKGFALSLSGGADSGTIAIMVSEMVRRSIDELGFDQFKQKIGIDLKKGSNKEIVGQLLHTAYQGTENSSEDTYLSAKELAEDIGATFSEWKIDSEVEAYRQSIEKALGRSLSWEKDDIALQNIQARARSPIIWMLANIKQFLLLSTSNRSEGDVGYATMDGDTSGSISPIAAVDKNFIIRWLFYAEQELGYKGLKRVNKMAPTAELRPKEMDQTDETDLMPYEVLVDIEQKAIRDKKSPIETYERLTAKWPDHVLLKTWIKKFFKMWAYNQWKRERIAPSFHLDDFNVDPRTWCRFPILSSGFDEELKELDTFD